MTSTVAADETGTLAARPSYPALDTMRAVGALAVVATHTAFWSGAYTQSSWGSALARLDVGVAVFFVLSGFLLGRPYLDRRELGLPPPGTGRYLWKRFLRIAPVYLVAATAALLLLDGNRDASPRDWLVTLTLTDLYLAESFPDGLTQMWSLATEVAFYLVLPLLMALGLGRTASGRVPTARFATLLAALVVFNAVWILELVGRLDVRGQVFQWLPSYLPWFAAGLGLAFLDVLHQRRGPVGLPHLVAVIGGSAGTCWVAALALLGIASTPIAGPTLLVPPTLGEALTKTLLYAAIATLLVLPAIQVRDGEDRIFARLITARPLRHLGHISYGIFCVHLIVLELIVEQRDITLFDADPWLLFWATALGSVVAAEVIYRVVELPVSRLRTWRVPQLRPSSRANDSSTRS